MSFMWRIYLVLYNSKWATGRPRPISPSNLPLATTQCYIALYYVVSKHFVKYLSDVLCVRTSVLFQLLRKHRSCAEKRWHLRGQLFGKRARGLHVDDEVRRSASQRRVLQIYGNAMNKWNIYITKRKNNNYNHIIILFIIISYKI